MLKDKDIFYNLKAYEGYKNATGDIRMYLDMHIRFLKEITIMVKDEIKGFQGFYVSSMYREPTGNWSPHQEGRAIDVSRCKIDNKWLYLKDSIDNNIWQVFYVACGVYFNMNCYNQILSPLGIMDVRNLKADRVKSLVDSHQDHFHLNVAKGVIN